MPWEVTDATAMLLSSVQSSRGITDLLGEGVCGVAGMLRGTWPGKGGSETGAATLSQHSLYLLQLETIRKMCNHEKILTATFACIFRLFKLSIPSFTQIQY